LFSPHSAFPLAAPRLWNPPLHGIVTGTPVLSKTHIYLIIYWIHRTCSYHSLYMSWYLEVTWFFLREGNVIFFYFLVVVGFELRALHLLCRCSTPWAAPSSPIPGAVSLSQQCFNEWISEFFHVEISILVYIWKNIYFFKSTRLQQKFHDHLIWQDCALNVKY
jgi:hypothetical protein